LNGNVLTSFFHRSSTCRVKYDQVLVVSNGVYNSTAICKSKEHKVLDLLDPQRLLTFRLVWFVTCVVVNLCRVFCLLRQFYWKVKKYYKFV